MARKNPDIVKIGNGKQRSVKYPNAKVFTNTTSPLRGEIVTQRLSPVRVSPSSQGSSPRTSPGLVAGHYAGCKWTEPPLPSALPLPPQHWMQSTRMSVRHVPNDPRCQSDIAHQLKVLLKVQA